MRRVVDCLVVLAMLGCDDDSRSSDPKSADGGPGDGVAIEDAPVPPGPPVIMEVSIPANAAGMIPVRVMIGDADNEPVRVTVELSLDGNNWKPARIEGAPLELPAGPTGVDSTVVWNSLKDVGFHVARSVQLRFTPSSEKGGAGAPVVVLTPVLHNVRAAAKLVRNYMVNYGRLTEAMVLLAQKHDLVIIHPTHGSSTREQVAKIQAGENPDDPSDDVIVLAYVSVGEDLRSRRIDDATARKDPRFRGDGTGPRVDPRGPNADGQPLMNLDPRGLPSPGGTGFASFYLDDNSLNLTGHADGIPDRNGIFNCFFVNAGDPNWYPVIDAMMIDTEDKLVGFREAMTTDWGRGLGADGVFLDTIDTAAPNYYTDARSVNPGKFEWTAAGFASFIRRIRENYPDKVILQNRGLFFFDPRQPHYEVTTRGAIDFGYFESYRLNSNSFEEYSQGYAADNRYNIAPKLMAEANRSDGFRVLSLGYAEGPSNSISKLTLLGQSTLGFDSLMEDIRVAQDLAGFRHYITDQGVELANTFVRDHANLDDRSPPWWTSSYNDNASPWPGTDPTPRVGIQEVATGPGAGEITVRWDVAMDKYPVRYALYYQTTAFDFQADPQLRGATRVVLDPVAPASYRQGVGPGVYANESIVRGLTPGQTYYLLIRAFDASPSANEEANTVVLNATAG